MPVSRGVPGTQVARARHACMPVQEAPRDLTPAERTQLQALHTRRLTDIVSKQCAAVLKHVQNHKVRRRPARCARCARCVEGKPPADMMIRPACCGPGIGSLVSGGALTVQALVVVLGRPCMLAWCAGACHSGLLQCLA